jgi:hypothetical protein
MAVFPTSNANINAPSEVLQATSPNNVALDIETWVNEAATALSTVALTESDPHHNVSATAHATTTAAAETITPKVTYAIPLDEHNILRGSQMPSHGDVGAANTLYKRRDPIRRDSLKRREALLKGKEGSRRRQRWENGMNFSLCCMSAQLHYQKASYILIVPITSPVIIVWHRNNC